MLIDMLDLVVENKLILCAKTGITQNILSVYIIKWGGYGQYKSYLHMSVICSERYILVVRFVDIGNIVDHHCLNFLFIDMYY